MRYPRWLESLGYAAQAIRTHKVRSLLTMLGIVIGVSVMLVVVSVLHGFRQVVIAQVHEFGKDNVYVFRTPIVQANQNDPRLRARKALTPEDALAIQRRCTSLEAVSVAAELDPARAVVRFRRQFAYGARVRGVWVSDRIVSHARMLEGRWFSEDEARRRQRVCLLGAAVVPRLFQGERAVGRWIEIDGRALRVIGVLAPHREGPFGNANPEDDVIRLPYSTFTKVFGSPEEHFIGAVAQEGLVDVAMAQITNILRERRRVPPSAEDDFWIGKADSLIATFDDLLSATLYALFAIGCIAFAVGALGILDIMLVSVTQRTRELGLRKALGATGIDITLHVLTEGALLGFLGGAAGLLLREPGLTVLMERIPGLPAETPPWLPPIAVGFATLVALLASLWPAWRASLVPPTEALRHT